MTKNDLTNCNYFMNITCYYMIHYITCTINLYASLGVSLFLFFSSAFNFVKNYGVSIRTNNHLLIVSYERTFVCFLGYNFKGRGGPRPEDGQNRVSCCL